MDARPSGSSPARAYQVTQRRRRRRRAHHASSTRTFRTHDLTLDQQTYASIAPIDGETVGVGMPVIVNFDVAVTDRAEIERAPLGASPSRHSRARWHWISDHEVHWRPKTYWQPGTDVTVNADINGVDAGNGIYGQEDRTTQLPRRDAGRHGRSTSPAHQMQVSENGKLLRTIPISAGKPGFTTRSGDQGDHREVPLQGHGRRDHRASAEDDPEYYNIDNVEYAQRVTYSGEFLHAAPWSVGLAGQRQREPRLRRHEHRRRRLALLR